MAKNVATEGGTVSIKEAAKMLGLASLIHVRGMVRKGKLGRAQKDEHGFWMLSAAAVKAEASRREQIARLRAIGENVPEETEVQ